MSDAALVEIFSTQSLAEASLLSQELESHGIRNRIMNSALQGVIGEVPFQLTAPRVCVMSADVDRALDLIGQRLQHSGAEAPVAADWICTGCAEANGPAFDECWNCRAQRLAT